MEIVNIINFVVIPFAFGSLVPLWVLAFLICIVVFFIKFFGAKNISDVNEKIARRKKAWHWITYPIYVLLAIIAVLVVLWIATNIIAGASGVAPA